MWRSGINPSSSFPPVFGTGCRRGAGAQDLRSRAATVRVGPQRASASSAGDRIPRHLRPRHRQRRQPCAGLQSGAICSAVLDWAASNKVGISSVIRRQQWRTSISAKLDYPQPHDNRSHYILLYIEGIRTAALPGSAHCASPIILLKAGRHAAGSAACRCIRRSAGPISSSMPQSGVPGVVRVKTIGKLFYASKASPEVRRWASGWRSSPTAADLA